MVWMAWCHQTNMTVLIAEVRPRCWLYFDATCSVDQDSNSDAQLYNSVLKIVLELSLTHWLPACSSVHLFVLENCIIVICIHHSVFTGLFKKGPAFTHHPPSLYNLTPHLLFESNELGCRSCLNAAMYIIIRNRANLFVTFGGKTPELQVSNCVVHTYCFLWLVWCWLKHVHA